MGAADEVSSLVQLAGGILFGGFALYKLTSQKDDVIDEGYETDESLSYQSSTNYSVTKPKTKPAYEVQKVQNVSVSPVEVEKTHKPSYSQQREHFTPSWMSQKDPQITVQHQEPTKISPSTTSSYTSESKSISSETFEDVVYETPSKKSIHKVEAPKVDFTPSWMSKKEPQVKLEQVQEAITQAPRVALSHVKTYSGKMQCGNASISRVAYGLSDTVFLYPLNSHVHFGNFAVGYQKERALNSFGQVPDVKVMETRAGAGSCVVGSLLGGSKTSVLASSDSLKLMTPSMFQIAANRLPTVFHVAATHVDNNTLAVTDNYAEIMKVRESGFAILGSASAQEIADLAIVAHAAAHKTSTPFLHFFDGTRGLTEIQKIRIPSLHNTAEYIRAEQTSPMATHGLESAATEDRPYVANAVQDAMNELAEPLSTCYKIFQYTGPEHPDAVVVAMGTAASVIEHVVHNSHTVGVINVRLLRPWSAHHFLSAIPKSVRRICVVDQSGAHMNPLFLDVASALHSESAAQLRVLPLLVGAKVVAGATGFDLDMAHAVVSNISSSRPQSNLVVKSDSNNGESRSDASDVIVWSKGSKFAAEASKAIALEVANEPSVNVQYFSSHDPYSETHKSEVRITPGGKGVIEGLAVKTANVVVAPSISLDVVASVSRDGTLIVMDTAQNLELQHVPESVNSLILRNGVTVLTLKEEFEKDCEAAWACVGAAIGLAEPSVHFRITTALRLGGRSLLNRYVENVHSLLEKRPQRSMHSSFANDLSVSSWRSTREVSTPVFGDEHTSTESFVPRFECKIDDDSEEQGSRPVVVPKHQFAWNMIFKDAFEATEAVRPGHHDVHIATITKNQRLTPDDYNRNIFHMEFDISDTPIKYQIGDALGVFGHNDEVEVEKFINDYGLDAEAFVGVPARGRMNKNQVEYVTVRNLLTQHLDLFGRPSKKFYIALAQHAKSRYQYLRLMHIGTDDAESFKLGIHETLTYADLLLQYDTARPTIEALVEMIPEIKARHYSISSSMKVCPRSVHLLVVAVDWETPLRRRRTGQCTRYLNGLRPGQKVTVDIQTSVLRLPPNPKQPIVMAGLGTGMAPFRAFIQERMWQKESGIDVGPCVLYFGARHKAQEWLYGEELEKYEGKGLVKLGLAWSRDQEHKVYIQHKITEDGELLKKYLGEDKGYFYLCGPTWPVPDVRDAIAKGLTPEKVKDGVVDVEVVEELKDDGRYILEVY
uniref:FAD-binding FR-type domain-containing protein n=1 Tax=Aplanochytrium stocchinoi TaxID=215587 RepID=A0A6S8FYT5_9STRA|mmetsp:Transcript_15327/g.18086  ORF Transcript_15327/g.18086 Transcript_15327/m.18086 type:complete len:1223 (-) Transcript_15327:61-3729(-)